MPPCLRLQKGCAAQQAPDRLRERRSQTRGGVCGSRGSHIAPREVSLDDPPAVSRPTEGGPRGPKGAGRGSLGAGGCHLRAVALSLSTSERGNAVGKWLRGAEQVRTGDYN